MEIYFDRKNLSILRRIYFSGRSGITWDKLQKKLGQDTGSPSFLVVLNLEGYIVTQNESGVWLPPERESFFSANGNFRSFTTDRGNELLQQRSFNFWKWVIPTLISVSALIISFIGLLL